MYIYMYMYISRAETLALRDIPNIRRQANTTGGGTKSMRATHVATRDVHMYASLGACT